MFYEDRSHNPNQLIKDQLALSPIRLNHIGIKDPLQHPCKIRNIQILSRLSQTLIFKGLLYKLLYRKFIISHGHNQHHPTNKQRKKGKAKPHQQSANTKQQLQIQYVAQP